MEKTNTNIIDALIEKGLSGMDAKLAIAIAMTTDKDLNDFVIKNALALIAFRDHDFEPSQDRVIVAMDACIEGIVHELKGASKALEDYKKRGDIAIIEGIAKVTLAQELMPMLMGIPTPVGKAN